MVLEYGHQLLRMPMTYFDSHRSGEVVSRIDDISRINALISQLVLGLPSQLFIAAVSLVVMLAYSLPLAVVSLLAFVLLVGSGLVFLPAQYEKNRRLIVESAENQGFLVEIFRGAQVLKTTEALPQVWDEYQRNFGSVAHLRWNTLQLSLFSGTTTGLLSRLTTLGLLWYGSSFVISGQLSIGQLLAFSGMGGNVLGFLESLVDFADDFLSARVVIRRLSEVLEGSQEDPKAMDKPWVALPPSCEIRCRTLSFHHVGRLDLLQDLNLTFPAGQCTALIGESGCGKSTLVKLLAGLYAPQGGSIHYGPYGRQDLSLECLRRQVILVPQESQFFNRTIFDNFRFAYPDLSLEQVVKACQIALADEFICELPDGYQTMLGEFGANLSGGQRQRLAIARALVSAPPVLILDESTAALDPVLESRLMERLLEERQGLTTLMISHRPRVIRRCDWVVYLERGAVVCQGRPHDLREIGALAAYLSPA
jgi:ABC-type bacteriocin/lantibiotic exporter with double-glycine peptidase domain